MQQIQLRQGETLLVLQGTGRALPLRGARWLPAASPPEGSDETVTEVLELALEGTPAAVEESARGIARLLEEGARQAGLPGGDWLWLEAAAAGGRLWRSKIRRGQIFPLGAGTDGRATGSQGLRLALERDPWWEDAALTWLPLSNTRGEGTPGWRTITNHWDGDAGHCCWVDIPAGAVGGDRLTPARLEFHQAEGWSPGSFTLLAGQRSSGADAGAPVIVEGESGAASDAAGTLLPDPDCSNGACLRLDWSGSATHWAWQAGLDPAAVLGMAGRPARIFARLASPHSAAASELTWAQWRLSWVDPGMVARPVATSAGSFLEGDSGVIFGPVLHIPPWPVPAGETYAAPLRLSLSLQSAGTGSHSLALDYVALVPLDGWRIYRPLSGIPGLMLVDDPASGLVRGEELVQTHLPEGPGLWLHPTRAARLYFFRCQDLYGQVTSPIDLVSELRVGARARVGMI